MPTLTRKSALLESLALWEYLASHPEQDKHDAFNLPEFAHMSTYTGWCPACQYAEQLSVPGGPRCDHCPITEWNTSTNPGIQYPCDRDVNSYYGWRRALAEWEETHDAFLLEESADCAATVVALIQASIKDLPHDAD